MAGDPCPRFVESGRECERGDGIAVAGVAAMAGGLLRALGALLVSSCTFGLSSGCAASQYEPSAFDRQSEPCGREHVARPIARRVRALTEEERAVLRERYSASAVATA